MKKRYQGLVKDLQSADWKDSIWLFGDATPLSTLSVLFCG